MRLRNGPHGYGAVTKVLHWLTVLFVLAQFTVGLTMDADDAALDLEEARIDDLERRGEDEAEQHGDAAEDAFDARIDRLEDDLDAREDEFVGAAFDDVFSGGVFDAGFLRDGISLPEAHVLLGLGLLAMGLLRVGWRAATPLPPWAPYLSSRERSLESAAEKVLLASLFVVPATGLLLIFVDLDWLWVHIGAQLVFLLAIGVHVGMVLRHTVWRRDGQLSRMLTGSNPP